MELPRNSGRFGGMVEQQVVIDLLGQLPITANRVEHHQQLGPQQLYRRNRVPTHLGLQCVDLTLQGRAGIIGHLPDEPHRTALRQSQPRAHRAEQHVFLSRTSESRIVSPICASGAGVISRKSGFFQHPVNSSAVTPFPSVLEFSPDSSTACRGGIGSEVPCCWVITLRPQPATARSIPSRLHTRPCAAPGSAG